MRQSQRPQPAPATRDTGNGPDWVAKSPRQTGRQERLERIGAGWNREDGGICVRLSGTQLITGDVYLYPVDDQPAD